MATTREHSSCLETSRATALAAHSAAGLAAAAGLREAARLLRSCEALARAATAALQSSAASASLARAEATPSAGQADVASANVPAASSAQRKKKKKNKKGGSDSVNMVIDSGLAGGGAPAAALAPASTASRLSPLAPAFAPGAVAASVRVLEKKVSRERSPRREASPAPLASSSASTSSTTFPASSAGVGGFSVGQTALLVDLVSRPELTGKSVTLRSFDAASSRWAVSLGTTDESIRVKTTNLRPSFFKLGAVAAAGEQG